MLEIGDRVICTKGEENYNTLVLGKTYEITDRALDSFGQWIYKLRSDDGITCNWIEMLGQRDNCYFMPVTWYRDTKLKELGI